MSDETSGLCVCITSKASLQVTVLRRGQGALSVIICVVPLPQQQTQESVCIYGNLIFCASFPWTTDSRQFGLLA